jgi:hypothetical protein
VARGLRGGDAKVAQDIARQLRREKDGGVVRSIYRECDELKRAVTIMEDAARVASVEADFDWAVRHDPENCELLGRAEPAAQGEEEEEAVELPY